MNRWILISWCGLAGTRCTSDRKLERTLAMLMRLKKLRKTDQLG